MLKNLRTVAPAPGKIARVRVVPSRQAKFYSARLSPEEQNKARKEIEEDKETLLQSFQKLTQNPRDISETLRASTDTLARDYKDLHQTLQGTKGASTWSQYPAEFYDLSPKEQEAQTAYYNSITSTYRTVLEKHGNDLAPGLARISAVSSRNNAPKKAPIRVCVTGASGQLGYALVFRVASGSMFGPDQPVILSLLELPQAMNALKGVVMELRDCAFPVLHDVIATDSADIAFTGADYALLVGAAPRSKGMERADLLQKNAAIFQAQGKALNSRAKGAETRVIVVGNPANTNALIASHNAPNIPPQNFSAMMRLDHNRALSQLAAQAKCQINDIERFVVWGNHSATQFPDISHATIKGKLATDVITDKKWLKEVFTPSVQNRGAEIIKARGFSSAASAASSCVDAGADIHFGTFGRWTSAGVVSDGSYGVTKGLFYGFPVVYNDQREWDIVRDLPIDEAAAKAMEATHKELLDERNAVASYLAR